MILKKDELYNYIQEHCIGDFSIGVHGIKPMSASVSNYIEKMPIETRLKEIYKKGLLNQRAIAGTIAFFGTTERHTENQEEEFNHYNWCGAEYYIVFAIPTSFKNEDNEEFFLGTPNIESDYIEYAATKGYYKTSLLDTVYTGKYIPSKYILGHYKKIDSDNIEFHLNDSFNFEADNYMIDEEMKHFKEFCNFDLERFNIKKFDFNLLKNNLSFEELKQLNFKKAYYEYYLSCLKSKDNNPFSINYDGQIVMPLLETIVQHLNVEKEKIFSNRENFSPENNYIIDAIQDLSNQYISYISNFEQLTINKYNNLTPNELQNKIETVKSYYDEYISDFSDFRAFIKKEAKKLDFISEDELIVRSIYKFLSASKFSVDILQDEIMNCIEKNNNQDFANKYVDDEIYVGNYDDSFKGNFEYQIDSISKAIENDSTNDKNTKLLNVAKKVQNYTSSITKMAGFDIEEFDSTKKISNFIVKNKLEELGLNCEMDEIINEGKIEKFLQLSDDVICYYIKENGNRYLEMQKFLNYIAYDEDARHAHMGNRNVYEHLMRNGGIQRFVNNEKFAIAALNADKYETIYNQISANKDSVDIGHIEYRGYRGEEKPYQVVDQKEAIKKYILDKMDIRLRFNKNIYKNNVSNDIDVQNLNYDSNLNNMQENKEELLMHEEIYSMSNAQLGELLSMSEEKIAEYIKMNGNRYMALQNVVKEVMKRRDSRTTDLYNIIMNNGGALRLTDNEKLLNAALDAYKYTAVSMGITESLVDKYSNKSIGHVVRYNVGPSYIIDTAAEIKKYIYDNIDNKELKEKVDISNINKQVELIVNKRKMLSGDEQSEIDSSTRKLR